MILNFNISNFKSFGDDQVFSTIPGRYRNKKEHIHKSRAYKSLKFSAIFGGNASGKSNFVESLSIFRRMVVTGKTIKTLKDFSFRLSDTMNSISKFELEIGIEDSIFAFGLAVDIQKGAVLREYLMNLTTKTVVYDLDNETRNKDYDSKTLSRDNENRLNIYIQDLKKDELLLSKISSSKLDITDQFFSTCKSVYYWFKNKLTIIKPNSRPINILGQFEEKKSNKGYLKVIDFIKSFDTGITGYKYEVLPVEDFLQKIKTEISNDDAEMYNSFKDDIESIEENSFIDANIGDNYYRVSFDKQFNKPKVELLTFEHCFYKDVKFTFNDESDGTMRLIELVNILYSSQFEEKIYVIDEINRSLHPNLTIEFIKKFLSIIVNKPSQMIITTHETNVMDLNLLRQDEIWIVERNNCGMSSLISLNKYNIRSDKVLDKDYLRGRYGGIPNIEKLLRLKGIQSD